MRFVPPLLLALLAFTPAATAAVPRGEPLMCFSAEDGTFALEGYVQVQRDGGYRYNPGYREAERAGGWTDAGDGVVAFADGPLGGATARPAPAGTTMAGDQIEGRTWPVLIEGPAGTWYCRSMTFPVRASFAADEGWVERRTGVDVRLPVAVVPQSLLFGEGPYTTVSGRVRVATRRLWRVELTAGPCSRGMCGSYGIFSAKRAPRADVEVDWNTKLARGARGWVGNVGCAFGSGIGWGPVYCGQTVIVWRHRGVNFCIEARGTSEAGLVRMANESLRDPS